ncbi:MAG: response regulator transcription factor [Firmicutes bacterium]|nr:response regulator transcription factor [Bacillota bacterium]MCL1953391.1 response regulator transcription factor [Bacillota bacterium]
MDNRTKSTKILVVDDDVHICQLYPLYFKKEGYETVICHNGNDALKLIKSDSFSIVLLDVMMPDLDGMETLIHIRQISKSLPVILVSAKSEKVDIIGGLEIGADDYITKPFEMQEVISRIKTILRRTEANATQETSTQDVSIGNLFVSINNYIVKVSGKRIEMPPKEIELLYHFVTHPMYVFSREKLLEKVWEVGYDGDTRTVDVHIKRIREKVGSGENWRFVTVWGKGYKFEID